jgi:hypothetical protein
MMTHTVPASHVKLKRAYEPAGPGDGTRILVDRLWPRGLSKAEAAVDRWLKEIAPSTELRQWFGHDPRSARWHGKTLSPWCMAPVTRPTTMPSRSRMFSCSGSRAWHVKRWPRGTLSTSSWTFRK